ncbi:MAG: hypothetical protein VKS61_04955 [Candidatus Sericytochromatia bacterium]|nr:hypothetical protein [Candidatus Sericytochromatia bacterium]MEB3221407.1 hypothetical protein [Candidatus Sericytochromatia bacterium]
MTATSNLPDALPPAADWNWRAELAALEAKMAHVASRSSWDWRQALADIEADLERIAARLSTPPQATS